MLGGHPVTPVAVAPSSTPTDYRPHPVTHGVLRLTPTTEAVKAARDYVGGLLALHDWPGDVVERAVVVVSELATNAVRHAGTEWELRCTVDDVAHVEVLDGDGTALPTLRDPEPGRPGGMGLHLVTAFASTWGVDGTPGGKTVWCTLDAGVRR